MNRLSKGSALACAVSLAACSDADPPSTRVPAFADLDTDGDGFLSRQETQRVPELEGIFEIADADGNGRLSVAEYSRATIEGTTVSPESAGGPQFDALDTNGDGAISLDEARQVPTLAENFGAFDEDESGTLDFGEYAEAVQSGLMPE